MGLLTMWPAWVFLALSAVFLSVSHRRPKNLPPGPKRWPFIDNLLDAAPKGGKNWEHYNKQKDIYGPISSLVVFGTTFILLHDLELAEDLLNKRAAIGSDRPRPFFLTQMCGWDNNIAFSPYNHRLRGMRKHIHSIIGTPQSLSKLMPFQDVEIRRFLLRTLRRPEKFLWHVRSEAASIMLRTIYGYQPNEDGTDHIIRLFQTLIADATTAIQPGAWLVDAIPALRYLPDWFPGTRFKQVAKEIKARGTEVARRPWEFVKQQMASGKYETCFVSRLHECASDSLDEETVLVGKYAANGLFIGGSDTTVASTMAFLLAMTHYPDVQAKAQAEIDAVVGHERLPGLEDRGRLPYTEALITEVLRWHIIVPEGLPHLSTENCEFEGYFIPKDAVLIPNMWWFGHNPEMYRNPDVFDPTRFLGDSPETDPRRYVFGFGRRVCPGKLFVEATLFLHITRTLAVFDIRPPLNSQGEEFPEPIDFEEGLISHAKDFKARITPRSDRHKELILEIEKTHPFSKSSEADLERVTKW